MNLQTYFKKIREILETLPGGPVVLISLETPDGGKAGVAVEVLPRLAAKLLVEGRARQATEEESRQFHEQAREAKRLADQQAAAERVQVTVVSAGDLRKAKN